MASTSSPIRRKTSASVRTVVVLPVPPFSDRTAIVSAMARARIAPNGDCGDDGARFAGRRTNPPSVTLLGERGLLRAAEPTVAVSRKKMLWRPIVISSPSVSGAHSTRSPLT